VHAVPLSELKSLSGDYAGGIFALSASAGLEECMDAVPLFPVNYAQAAS